MDLEEYQRHDATDLSDLVRREEVTAVELLSSPAVGATR